MEIYKKYPREFIDFIGRLEITPENAIIENVLDKDSEFVSRYFTPKASIGELSRKVLESIHAKEVITTNNKLRAGSLGDLLLNKRLINTHPNLKPYLQAILLEVVALDVAIEHAPELRQYVNEKDISRVRDNITYALDLISIDPRFTKEYKHLQDLYINLGYIEAQVPVIKQDGEEILNGEV